MRFYISKASSLGRDEEPPCKGARLASDSDPKDPTWVIEVEDLDALLGFMDAEGGKIVLSSKFKHAHPWLTIYDDYLE